MPERKLPVSLICKECGGAFEVQPYRALTAKYCSFICGNKAKAKISAAINGPKWRGGGEGKTYIKLNGRHMHRVVAEKTLGRPLRRGEIVHHLDGNKRNNAPDNLHVISQPDHIRLHIRMMLSRRKEVAGY